MALEGLEQATGLLKQIVIAAQFGTTERMDAYLVATTVVGLVLLWVTLPIGQTLIPIFRHDLSRHGEAVAWRNAGVLFNNVALILVVISAALAALAPALVAVVAPGFDEATRDLASSLSRWIVPSLFFVGAGRVLSQIHFSYQRFFTPGAAGTLNNAVVVAAFLALGQAHGIHGLAVATVLGAAAEFVLQLPILWEKRKLYTLRVDLRDPQMAEVARLGLPLLVSAGGSEVERVTDRMFASLMPAGRLTALALANRLINLAYDFFVRPLQRSTYPHFARLSAERDFPTLSRQLFHYLRVVFLVTVPVAVGAMVLSRTTVRLMFQRGAFDETSVRLTSQALLAYAIGLPATALSRILDRTFFTLKDTRTPTRMALLRIGLKVVLAFALIRPLGHLGVALAESLSQLIRLPLLFRALPAEIRRRRVWPTVLAFARTAAAGAVMGAAVALAGQLIGGTVPLPLEAASLVAMGAGVFAAAAFAFAREETRSVLGAAAGFGRRRGRREAEEDDAR
jgi:putative peptidoglycan lipid II flippase